jgi:hypothetical protein
MELITADTVTAIHNALVPVAEKIGQGAGYAWDIVVMQQYVSGISYLIVSFFLFAVALTGVYFIRWALSQPKVVDDLYGTKMQEMSSTASTFTMFGIFMQVGWFFGVVFLTNGIMMVLNPQFYALAFFISLVK